MAIFIGRPVFQELLNPEIAIQDEFEPEARRHAVFIGRVLSGQETSRKEILDGTLDTSEKPKLVHDINKLIETIPFINQFALLHSLVVPELIPFSSPVKDQADFRIAGFETTLQLANRFYQLAYGEDGSTLLLLARTAAHSPKAIEYMEGSLVAASGTDDTYYTAQLVVKGMNDDESNIYTLNNDPMARSRVLLNLGQIMMPKAADPGQYL